MSYVVIARKWRPKKFSDLVGQDHVAKTLKNAILTDRIAHGYIFTGPRGVGKTSSARIYAKALNCEDLKDGEPCNQCSSCLDIGEGHSMDVIEIDGASNNSVDNIRDLRDNIRYTPTGGKYKIYIIDEVHMLSKGAFNALLKTLEEPPEHAIFIFATTEIHKVLPTILSRCQRFDFKRIPVQLIMERLELICEAEGIKINRDGLLQIAKKADGGMRDSQSLLDQLISFCGTDIKLEDIQASLGIISHELFFKIIDIFIKREIGRSFQLINEIFQNGYDLSEVLHGLEEHLRNLLVIKSTNEFELIQSIDEYKDEFKRQAEVFSEKDILRIIDVLQKTEQLIRFGQDPKLKVELAFAKICQMDQTIELDELKSLLRGEKKKLKTIGTEAVPNASRPVNQTLDTNGNTNLVSKNIKSGEVRKKPANAESINKKPINKLGNEAEPRLNTSFKDSWKSLISLYQKTKPALSVCLRQSAIRSADNLKAIIIFDDTDNGKFNLNTFKMNKEIIQGDLQRQFSVNMQLEGDLDNFDKLGIKTEISDLNTVVSRLKEKNDLFDDMIKNFGLEAISIRSKK